jgi:6-phosphogluconolactonase (cycloisomerase 2 family)
MKWTFLTPTRHSLGEERDMRPIRVLVTLLLICVSTSFAQTIQSTATTSPTVAFVYLGGRDTQHPIAALSVQSNGSAHLVSRSPFTAAALTSSSPQTLLAVSGNYVFASDTENIATFRRGSNGALTFVSSVVVAPDSATIDTLTLDRTASTLYAGGGRFGAGEYFIFDKGTGGHLTAATLLTGTQSDGELQFDHSNYFAYTAYQPFLNLPEITGQHCSFEAYSRTADGSLNPFDPALSPPPGVAASDFCPASVASSALGYVAIAYGTLSQGTGTGVHSIAVYRILTSGDLRLVSKLVTTLDAQLPVTLRFNPSGTFLAAVGTQGIQLYKLSSAGTLTKSGSPLYTHTHFRDVRWDHSNHVITISFGAVYFFGLNSGELVQTSPPIDLGHAGIRDIKVVSLQ